MAENIKNNYSYKKVNLEDGDYLDISINLPLPQTTISQTKDLDKKYLKCFLNEAVEMFKSIENTKDADERLKIFNNFQKFATLLLPSAVYTSVIIYKRWTRGLNPNNSRKENMLPRFKGLGCAGLFFMGVFALHRMCVMTINETRRDYLREILGIEVDPKTNKSDINNKSILDEYEKFKYYYSESIKKL